MSKQTETRLAPRENVDLTQKVILRSEFGRRVWSLMMERQMNQSDLARAAEIGRDSISQYVRGKNIPTPQNLNKLAKALGVKADELLPNYAASAAAKETPTFQIQQVGDDPNEVWLHINQKTTSEKAMKIMAILNQ